MLTLRRWQIGSLVMVVLALASPARAAEVDKLLPEDTEVVLVVNAKQLLEAPLVKKHFLEHLRAIIKGNNEMVNILNSLGFDPFKDLTSMTGTMNMVSNDAKGVLITHGQFDKAKFEAKAEEVAKEKSDLIKVSKEGERKIYEIKRDAPEKPVFVGVVDPTTIVAGSDKQYVADAFAKAQGKTAGTAKKAIQDLVAKADATQSIWLTATANAFLKGELSGDERTKKNLEKLDSITAGLTVDKGVKLNFTIVTKTPANAKELAEDIKEGLSQAKGLVTLMAEQDKNLAPLVDVVGNLQVNTDGNTITIKSEMTEEQFEKFEKSLKKN